jgi:hypothetical protein
VYIDVLPSDMHDGDVVDVCFHALVLKYTNFKGQNPPHRDYIVVTLLTTTGIQFRHTLFNTADLSVVNAVMTVTGLCLLMLSRVLTFLVQGAVSRKRKSSATKLSAPPEVHELRSSVRRPFALSSRPTAVGSTTASALFDFGPELPGYCGFSKEAVAQSPFPSVHGFSSLASVEVPHSQFPDLSFIALHSPVSLLSLSAGIGSG